MTTNCKPSARRGLDDEERALMRDCAKAAFAEILRQSSAANEAFEPDRVAQAAFAAARSMVRAYRAELRRARSVSPLRT